MAAAGVQSWHLVGRVQDEVIRLRCMDFADAFLRRELLMVLRRRARLYSAMKPSDTHMEKILIVIRIAFPSRYFAHTLHSVDLSFVPW